uniref:Putative secreted protein n=1 Tax=Anopheles darlingi TaxID=43151 RepID=A0A2M4DI55_ANODA
MPLVTGVSGWLVGWSVGGRWCSSACWLFTNRLLAATKNHRTLLDTTPGRRPPTPLGVLFRLFRGSE